MNKIIIPLMVLLILTIAIPLQEAIALITVKDFKMKFVVTFTRTGTNIGAITNFLNNQVFPDMQTDLITKLDANFINYTISFSNSVYEFGNDRYQFYPKIFFDGNTNLNKSQLANGLDATIDDWLSTVITHMNTQGATDRNFHVHKSFGSINVSG